jgi:hypothetical protein
MKVSRKAYVVFENKRKMFFNESKDSMVENLDEATLFINVDEAFGVIYSLDYPDDSTVWEVELTIKTQ